MNVLREDGISYYLSPRAAITDKPSIDHERRSKIYPKEELSYDTSRTTFNKIKSPLLVHQFLQQERNVEVLPHPSQEQRNIIDAVIQKGQCVSIRACAGSGKTTCMLQIATSLPPGRHALIITYNRSLADECEERIKLLRVNNIKCYTIHGLVSRFANRICNDDHRLMQQLEYWDNNNVDNVTNFPPLDLVMIDEAQDLRPLFHRILSHIFLIAQKSGGIQLCLVGDPKQMLYDFPTYGEDKASTCYFLHPERYWRKFTKHRTWKHLSLSVSYRLTPNIASFCNLFWGTSMIGGNVSSDNVPVEYMIKYPYPDTRGSNDSEKLQTSFLAKLIDKHGPENVMFLAQSVKRVDLPVRVHVNQLMKIKSSKNLQKYNFHIKENARGFEGMPDYKNKVRVWTFCGSKGCEADAVVIFGFDVFNGRPHALNQIGVALSRARKKLIVVHGKKYEAKKCLTMPFYPIMGDDPEEHIVKLGPIGEEINLRVPAIEMGEDSRRSDTYTERCELSMDALSILARKKVIAINKNRSSFLVSEIPAASGYNEKEVTQVYVASEFDYFSASAETRFLKYGTWTKSVSIFGDDEIPSSSQQQQQQGIIQRIHYETNVHFATTTEDVSALYGEAVVYMLQWEVCNYVPNIETVVSNGMVRLDPYISYSEENIRKMLQNMSCESLTIKDDQTLKEEFSGKKGIKGQDLVPFINKRINIKKKRKGPNNKEIIFPVKATERDNADDDVHLMEFLPQIKALYNSPKKKPFHWIYLANAVMAFSNYHEKFRQIGTKPNSYKSWVNSRALTCGLARLQNLMNALLPSSSFCRDNGNNSNNISIKTTKRVKEEDNSCDDNDVEGTSPSAVGTFEKKLSIDFHKKNFITDRNNYTKNGRITIVGVAGACDWMNSNVDRSIKTDENGDSMFDNIDILEIKFVHTLCNSHRLQTLIYTALYALEVNGIKTNIVKKSDDILSQNSAIDDDFGTNDDHDQILDDSDYRGYDNDDDDEIIWKVEYCRGMLYNARTGEIEICTIEARNAMNFLLDISQFKYNGKDRNDKDGDNNNIQNKQQNLSEKRSLIAPNSSSNHNVSSSHHYCQQQFRGSSKKRPRILKDTCNIYIEPLCVDDNDESIIGLHYELKNRPKTSLNFTQGTSCDPIILD